MHYRRCDSRSEWVVADDAGTRAFEALPKDYVDLGDHSNFVRQETAKTTVAVVQTSLQSSIR